MFETTRDLPWNEEMNRSWTHDLALELIKQHETVGLELAEKAREFFKKHDRLGDTPEDEVRIAFELLRLDSAGNRLKRAAHNALAYYLDGYTPPEDEPEEEEDTEEEQADAA